MVKRIAFIKAADYGKLCVRLLVVQRGRCLPLSFDSCLWSYFQIRTA